MDNGFCSISIEISRVAKAMITRRVTLIVHLGTVLVGALNLSSSLGSEKLLILVVHRLTSTPIFPCGLCQLENMDLLFFFFISVSLKWRGILEHFNQLTWPVDGQSDYCSTISSSSSSFHSSWLFS